MTTRITTGLLGLLLLCMSALPCVAAPQKYDDKKFAAITTVVVKSTSLGEGTKGKKDGAIVIQNAPEVKRLTDLLLKNEKTIHHACGYTYDIEFWQDTTLFDEIQYNLECGEEFLYNTQAISELVQSYDKHFISGDVDTRYFAEVPAEQEPKQLLQTMRADGLLAFPVGSFNTRYPFVDFTMGVEKKDSDKNYDTINEESRLQLLTFLAKWPAAMPKPLGHKAPQFSGSMSGLGLVSVDHRTEVWFPLGTDVQKIAGQLEGFGATIKNKGVPTYYIIELICPKKERGKIANKMEKYPGVIFSGPFNLASAMHNLYAKGARILFFGLDLIRP